MALGSIQERETQRKIYLNINHGQIEHPSEDGKQTFRYVEGEVKRITQKNRTFRGESVVYWYIDIADGDDLYSLGFSYTSGTFKSIILCLANFKELTATTPVKIEPYEKGGYTKVVVWADGIKQDWITRQLPQVKTVNVGGREVKDETERMNYITELATMINARVGYKGSIKPQ
jgi:hypothetical protein